ncbi:hypothetical protein BURC_02020 [Burkholderiaceae bacterium]|nr:hypothetical protein BURC_02020 [Burkholderiaceae bacterium]
MSTINPYSPPRAHVADIDDVSSAVQEIRIWSARGRIGRLRFLAYGFAGYLLIAMAGGALGAIGGLVDPVVAGAGVVLAVVAYLVFGCLIAIQRAHDMGWSGWTILLLLIPLVALVWIFNGGTRGANRFGAPPPPNTWGVRVLALMLPAVFVIGIIAAVAIPAYQDYTVRAQAARIAK